MAERHDEKHGKKGIEDQGGNPVMLYGVCNSCRLASKIKLTGKV